jgi:hypothetical protein
MTLHRITRRGLLVVGVAGVAGLGIALPVRADLRQLVAQAKPSVLPIGTYAATDSPRFGFRGTGFVVGDGNQLVTNFHVLPPSAEVDSGPRMAVLIPRGREGELRMARVQSTDRLRDLALLRFEGSPLAPLPLAEPELTAEGSSVALIGFPIGGVLGFSPTGASFPPSPASCCLLPRPSSSARGRCRACALARSRSTSWMLWPIPATAAGPCSIRSAARSLASSTWYWCVARGNRR